MRKFNIPAEPELKGELKLSDIRNIVAKYEVLTPIQVSALTVEICKHIGFKNTKWQEHFENVNFTKFREQ